VVARRERWFKVFEDEDGTVRIVTTGRISISGRAALVSIPLRAARILQESGGVLVVKIIKE